jgi:hypothetical protein
MKLPSMQNFKLSKNACLGKIRSVVLGSSVALDVGKGPLCIKIYDERAC